jgi:hypothetical protein
LIKFILMDSLIIEPTPETPKVNFDANTGRLNLSGRSLPEDAIAYYRKLFDWLANYSKEPKPSTLFNINLEYYNTATSKQLYKMLCVLEELNRKSKVEVNWTYNKDDIDMLAQGERLAKMVLIKFNLIEN